MAALVVLLAGILACSPIVAGAGENPAGEASPVQRHLLSKDQIEKVQERLQAEGFDPGPIDGVMKPQTEAALRSYQQKEGLPVSGAPDEATLKNLQIRITPGGAGSP